MADTRVPELVADLEAQAIACLMENVPTLDRHHYQQKIIAAFKLQLGWAVDLLPQKPRRQIRRAR